MKLDPKGIEAAVKATYDPGPTGSLDQFRESIFLAALTAYMEATGTVLVPREATVEQLNASFEEAMNICRQLGGGLDKELFLHEMSDYYRAILNAAQEE